MRVALRIEVATWRGLTHGVPALLGLLDQYGIKASFLFALGHDLSGRQPIRTWRRRDQLGLAAMLYGNLLLPPYLPAAAAELMHRATQDGHDVGLAGLSGQTWAAQLAHGQDAWVEAQFKLALDRYRQIMGAPPTLMGVSGWQTHPRLLALQSAAGMDFASDVRGRFPFYPVLRGVRGRCVQIPTTLPTIDELLRLPGVERNNVHEHLYAESCRILPAGHVYTARAEAEGIGQLDLMEKMLVMWKGQDGAVRNLTALYRELDRDTLAYHQIGWDTVPGGTGYMAMQSVVVGVDE